MAFTPKFKDELVECFDEDGEQGCIRATGARFARKARGGGTGWRMFGW